MTLGIKELLSGSIAIALATIDASLFSIICACLFWLVNFGVGLYTGVHIQREEVSQTKAVKALVLILVVAGIIASVSLAGILNGATLAQRLFAIRAISYLFCYFMALNINKNLLRNYPNDPFLLALQKLLTLEGAKYFPFLRKKDKDETGNNK